MADGKGRVGPHDLAKLTNLLPQLNLTERPIEPVYPKVNYLQCALEKSNRPQTVRKHASSALVPSQMLLDDCPTEPTKKSPRQRSILPFKGETSKKFIVYLTASGLYERSKEEVDDLNQEGSLLHSTKQITDQKNVHKRFTNGLSNRIFREPILLISFRPLLAPFVPELLCLLVNSIESYCHQHSWALLFEPLPEYYSEAKNALVQLIQIWYDRKAMKRLIRKLSVSVKIVTVRLFLSELSVKPLLLKRKHVMELVKIPLFDFFLRPQSGVRGIVQRAILASSAVHVDTMAFIMLHLIHAWESAPNPTEGKIQLANIYGHLLISFSEKPELRGFEYADDKTIESALLEVVLEICDYHFWNHLTSLKIRAAFKNATEMERHMAAVERFKKRESCRLFKCPLDECVVDQGSDQGSDSGYFTMEKFPKPHTFHQNLCQMEDEISTHSQTEPTSMDTRTWKSSDDSDEGSRSEILPTQSKRTTKLMSFISWPVPQVLPFAEVSLLRTDSIRQLGYQNKLSTRSTSYRPPHYQCRKTSDILRDIFRFRLNRSVYQDHAFKRLFRRSKCDRNILKRNN